MVEESESGSPERQVLDPHNLRGLAHPLRVRLLGLLRDDGPSTATKLADRVGQSSGATSYHLRQLATYGFVVEDADHTGPGRERWWKAVSLRTELPGATAREASGEAEGFLRALAAEHFQQVDAFLSELPTIPAAWDESWALNDGLLRLTATEAKRFLRDVRDVVRRYRHELPGAEVDAPKGAERVVIQMQVLPRLRGSGGP